MGQLRDTFVSTGPPTGDISLRRLTCGFFTNTIQQGVSSVSHFTTCIANVLTNVAFTDVHLQKFHSEHIFMLKTRQYFIL